MCSLPVRPGAKYHPQGPRLCRNGPSPMAADGSYHANESATPSTVHTSPALLYGHLRHNFQRGPVPPVSRIPIGCMLKRMQTMLHPGISQFRVPFEGYALADGARTRQLLCFVWTTASWCHQQRSLRRAYVRPPPRGDAALQGVLRRTSRQSRPILHKDDCRCG